MFKKLIISGICAVGASVYAASQEDLNIDFKTTGSQKVQASVFGCQDFFPGEKVENIVKSRVSYQVGINNAVEQLGFFQNNFENFDQSIFLGLPSSLQQSVTKNAREDGAE